MSPVLLHGRIEDDTIFRLGQELRARRGELTTFDLVYADPPWGPGLLSAFHKMNKEQHALGAWGGFLASFAKQVVQVIRSESLVFIDISNKHADDVQQAFENYGIMQRARYEVGYRAGNKINPHTLWLGSLSPIEVREPSQPRMLLDRYDFVGMWASDLFGSSFTFLDPCFGLGILASRVAQYGAEIYGAEVNEDRLARGTAKVLKTLQIKR